MKLLECSQRCTLIFRRPMAANLVVGDGILTKLIQDFMPVLVTCKNNKDPYKNEGTRVLTKFLPLSLWVFFPERSRAANSAVPDWILQYFEPIQDFIVVLVTCKNEEDTIKNG